MHFYLCPPKVDLRAFLVTQGVIPLQLQYEGSYWTGVLNYYVQYAVYVRSMRLWLILND